MVWEQVFFTFQQKNTNHLCTYAHMHARARIRTHTHAYHVGSNLCTGSEVRLIILDQFLFYTTVLDRSDSRHTDHVTAMTSREMFYDVSTSE